MSLIVEDGTGLASSESYVSVVDCALYASNRGLVFPSDPAGPSEQALRRGTAYIDSAYRARFMGYRTNRRAQSLEWPRQSAFYKAPDAAGPTPYFVDPRAFYPYDLIPSNIVPIEIRNATCEAAIREFEEPGALWPDLDRGNGVKELKAGSVEIKYGASAASNTIWQAIDAALSGLIGNRSQYSARAVRA